MQKRGDQALPKKKNLLPGGIPTVMSGTVIFQTNSVETTTNITCCEYGIHLLVLFVHTNQDLQLYQWPALAQCNLTASNLAKESARWPTTYNYLVDGL